jgi:hypothetical protein
MTEADIERDGYPPFNRNPESCGECEHFKRCSIEGHEEIGWCKQYGEFAEAGDEPC